MPIVLDASQVVIKQPTNRGSTGERKGRGGGRRGVRTRMTELGIVVDVGTTDVGIGMGGDHDGKQHWGGGEVTGDAAQGGGEATGDREHCCLWHWEGGEATGESGATATEGKATTPGDAMHRQSRIGRRKSVVRPGQTGRGKTDDDGNRKRHGYCACVEKSFRDF
jgi:hypothetical protein